MDSENLNYDFDISDEWFTEEKNYELGYYRQGKTKYYVKDLEDYTEKLGDAWDADEEHDLDKGYMFIWDLIFRHNKIIEILIDMRMNSLRPNEQITDTQNEAEYKHKHLAETQMKKSLKRLFLKYNYIN
ncbi:MAG: hypothetical protein P4L35_07820 [Ignavibacteriaceae bacterium]|nr:hypothetical protein [Ignavibacteriaceae bacterium]